VPFHRKGKFLGERISSATVAPPPEARLARNRAHESDLNWKTRSRRIRNVQRDAEATPCITPKTADCSGTCMSPAYMNRLHAAVMREINSPLRRGWPSPMPGRLSETCRFATANRPKIPKLTTGTGQVQRAPPLPGSSTIPRKEKNRANFYFANLARHSAPPPTWRTRELCECPVHNQGLRTYPIGSARRARLQRCAKGKMSTN